MFKFESWADVLAWIKADGELWYHAPMDPSSRKMCVVKVYKNETIRIDPETSDADPFTIDATHLDRCRRK